ncbi:hypothetical protein TREMEDRAFT_66902 [Tremella mesenterica DSM 1558]|uniref:uncharacterized protein n=1 Tax=Tremella mesenterica (strain ATCC 24925 / CBS 8224 / DSM 1558 / NBRC 9311 / NRRL Y-6157 / RJB 2259-6 / UBC 559-6) TaxID=578456 RepID=UPI0003F49558|nr:uncharacterized protein TREMEDRAFT_66902 [Tremella mesenterica DSM 1558]EIW72480.1 hypothetical protein TREMEDRAFT_66902 [Tremella mesenterica DSM 1558]
MFGTNEGPWNIALRLENRLGPRLKVQAIVDINPKVAEAALAKKRATFVKSAYEETVIVPSVKAYKELVDAGKVLAPKAIFVATPPRWRGSLEPGKDLEVQLVTAFPEANIFLEKPVATNAPWEKSVEDAKAIGEMDGHNEESALIISYVLRYVRGAREMKRILEENHLTVMATVARYFGAYELAYLSDWWDVSKSHGPILEQGTHLCDLSRFFGGDIDTDTMQAHALEAYEKPAANLSKLSFSEEGIPLAHRVPRATSATWKYESGAVGTFVHGTLLQGVDYAIEIEVYADGHQLILQDPFGVPSISVRKPGSDIPEVIQIMGDDPYQTEMDAFIDAIENPADNRILSSFEDAAKTYEMTWYLKNSASASSARLREKKGIKLEA